MRDVMQGRDAVGLLRGCDVGRCLGGVVREYYSGLRRGRDHQTRRGRDRNGSYGARADMRDNGCAALIGTRTSVIGTWPSVGRDHP